MACVASYHDFSPSLDHRDIATVEKELVYLDQVLQMAAHLGSRVVRIYSGYLHPGIEYEKQWDSCVEATGEACSMAEDYGVYLALQNHSPISSFVDEVLALVREVGSNRLKVVSRCSSSDGERGGPTELGSQMQEPSNP